MNENIKHTLTLFIQSSNAVSGPPIGTVLGNLGVNAVKFAKDFNDFTKDLPYYFVLKVKIYIYENRTYSFITYLPSTSCILNYLKIARDLKMKKFNKYITVNVNGVLLIQVLKLIKLKFVSFSFLQCLPIIWSTMNSSKLKIFIK